MCHGIGGTYEGRGKDSNPNPQECMFLHLSHSRISHIMQKAPSSFLLLVASSDARSPERSVRSLQTRVGPSRSAHATCDGRRGSAVPGTRSGTGLENGRRIHPPPSETEPGCFPEDARTVSPRMCVQKISNVKGPVARWVTVCLKPMTLKASFPVQLHVWPHPTPAL